MMPYAPHEIARAVHGTLKPASNMPSGILGVVTDTRSDCAGCLFIALKGGRFDAHDYLHEAYAKGAALFLVSRTDSLPEGAAAIVVKDTRQALKELALDWRSRFSIPLVALTGSNGKTTTREMLTSIFKHAYGKKAVLSTEGNFNNDIGLPLTLLRLSAEHRVAVVELGMNHPGEIADLVRIARPDIALVTNAQKAHLEGMGTLEAVAREKAAIYGMLPEGGIAIINDADPQSGYWRSLNTGRRVIGFGLDIKNPHTAISGKALGQGLKTLLTLETPKGSCDVRLCVSGRHNCANALAASAAAFALNVDLKSIAQGLENFAGVKGRLEPHVGLNGSLILDDTYNANPDSVRAGIDVLASLPGRKILVLGDMGEIGAEGLAQHGEIGGYARSQGIARLFALGDLSKEAACSFGVDAAAFETPETLLDALKMDLKMDDVVLVKGSRFMKMERLARALVLDQGKDTRTTAGGAH